MPNLVKFGGESKTIPSQIITLNGNTYADNASIANIQNGDSITFSRSGIAQTIFNNGNITSISATGETRSFQYNCLMSDGSYSSRSIENGVLDMTNVVLAIHQGNWGVNTSYTFNCS